MAGLKEVAAMAKVSIRTAARALNGTGYVGAATRKRILAKASLLDYRPNLAARSLRMARSYEIVVLAWSMDELHVGKIVGLEQTLRTAHHPVSVLFGTADRGGGEELLAEVRRRQPAAVAILPAPERLLAALARGLADLEVPCVGIDTQLAGLDAIRLDRQQGVYEAGLYLAARNRQHSAYLGYARERSRVDGYLRAMQQLGRQPLFIPIDEKQADQYACGRAAARGWGELRPRPDAVQAYTDEMALGFLTGLHELGVRVPADVALVGFNDHRAAALACPPLTTVAQPSREVGIAAAEVLLGKLAGASPPAQGWTRVLPTKLVVRESA